MKLFMHFISKILSFFPHSWLCGFARILTFLVFDLFRVRRSILIKNIETAYGSSLTTKQKMRLARESVYNFLLTGFEFLSSRNGNIADHVSTVGQENLEAALAQGKGVYILCMHLGNWEAMASYMTKNITPSHVLVKRVGQVGLNSFVEDLRTKNQFLSVKRKKKGDGFAAIQKILSQNEVVGFVMDQARPGSDKLNFFGTPASTNTSFAAIWRRNPAPIIPAYAYRQGFGQHEIRFKPEVQLVTSSDQKSDLIEHSTLFNQIVENCIREIPEQYFWMHNRWKH